MATTTTKFGIGDTFYTFDPCIGKITSHVVIGIGIRATGGLSMAPEISYQAAGANSPNEESECMTSQEATDAGNAWLADKSTNMFISAGL